MIFQCHAAMGRLGGAFTLCELSSGLAYMRLNQRYRAQTA